MNNLELEVNSFIQRRFPIDCNWLNGNCYYFALILKERFGGKIYYDSIKGHFLTRIDDEFFDYSGKVLCDKRQVVLFDEIEKTDISHYNRLVRDCIG